MISGVKAHWILAPGVKKAKTLIIHAHGGGYFAGEAALMADLPAKISALTKLPVLTIEYDLAPEAPWPSGLNQLIDVYKALIKQGYDAKNIGLTGESAGGGLVLSGIQSMKHHNLELPAVVFVMSPWTDLAIEGDSYNTLSGKDPFIAPSESHKGAAMYVGKNDPKNPEISPVYGNFTNHPPLLIQAGSKEILLSDATRLARAARTSGVDVTLDIWDGMWHVFQDYDAIAPEAMEALTEASAFINKHLN